MNSAHTNGFMTYQEMSLIKDGLELLQDQYNTADNPPALRTYASRQANECADLLNVFRENKDRMQRNHG